MFVNGTLIDNRFEVLDTIGVGGFGTVVKARQVQFDRLVAIKLLKTTLLNEPDGLLRFEREAKAINALKHKNIVGFYGYGSWINAPYMVMELIEGIGLDKIIAAGKLEPNRALKIMAQVCQALDFAHRHGVVHRDLKPSNIMIVTDANGSEVVKIIDFGLAKLMPSYGIVGQKLTETGYALGTCHYMPPEQALGLPVDQRADIYSAGCILQHALTGDLPFDAQDNVAVMFQHVHDSAPPLSKQLGSSKQTSALQIFVDNCIAKNADDRYPNGAEAARNAHLLADGRYDSVLRFNSAFFRPGKSQKSQATKDTSKTLAFTAIATLGLFGFTWFYANLSSSTITEDLHSGGLETQFYQALKSLKLTALSKGGKERDSGANLDDIERTLSIAKRFVTSNPREATRLLEQLRPQLASATMKVADRTTILLLLVNLYTDQKNNKKAMEVSKQAISLLAPTDTAFGLLTVSYLSRAQAMGQSAQALPVALTSARALEQQINPVPQQQFAKARLLQIYQWLATYYTDSGDIAHAAEVSLRGLKIADPSSPAYMALTMNYGLATLHEVNANADLEKYIKEMELHSNPELSLYGNIQALCGCFLDHEDPEAADRLIKFAATRMKTRKEAVLCYRDQACIYIRCHDLSGARTAINRICSLLPSSGLKAPELLAFPRMDATKHDQQIALLEIFLSCDRGRLPAETRTEIVSRLVNEYRLTDKHEHALKLIEQSIAKFDIKSPQCVRLAEVCAVISNHLSEIGKTESARESVLFLANLIEKLENCHNGTLQQDSPLYISFSDLQWRLQDKTAALRWIDRGLNSHPKSGWHGRELIQKARLMSRMRNFQTAINLRKAALATADVLIMPLNERIAIDTDSAIDFLAESKIEECKLQLQSISKLLDSQKPEERTDSDAECYRSLSYFYYKRIDDPRTASLLLEQALERYPKAPQRPIIWLTLSTMRLRLSDVSGAVLAIRRAQADPTFGKYNASDFNTCAWLLLFDTRESLARNEPGFARIQLDELRTLFSNIKTRSPDSLRNGRLHTASLAHDYAWQGDLTAASRILEDALAVIPPNSHRSFEYLELAKVRLRMSQRASALEAFRKADSEPGFGKMESYDKEVFRIEAAILFLDAGAPRQCRIQLDKLKKLADAPGASAWHICYYYGLINSQLLEKLEPDAEIERPLQARISTAPHGYSRLCDQHTLARVYIDRGNLTAAYNLLHNMSSEYPADYMVMIALADVCRMTQRNEEGRKLYNRALALEPEARSWPIWFADFPLAGRQAKRRN